MPSPQIWEGRPNDALEDDGCSYSPACLDCPLSVCRHDDAVAARREWMKLKGLDEKAARKVHPVLAVIVRPDMTVSEIWRSYGVGSLQAMSQSLRRLCGKGIVIRRQSVNAKTGKTLWLYSRADSGVKDGHDRVNGLPPG